MVMRFLLKRVKMPEWFVVFVLTIVLDIVDYFGGFIPVVGDVLDIMGVILLWYFIGLIGIFALVELIPLVDFLPTFVFIAFASLWFEYKGKWEKLRKELSEYAKEVVPLRFYC